MSENVVSLYGTRIPDAAAEPNPTVVEEIERLLAAARAGEIIGLAGSYMHRDKVVTYSYAGAVGAYGVIGGLECLKDRLVRVVHREG